MNKKLLISLLSFLLMGTNFSANAEDIFDLFKNINKQKEEKEEKNQKSNQEKNFKFTGVIEPFGELSWDDNLKDVFIKLSKLTGLEEFSLNTGSEFVNLKSVKQNEFAKKVSELILKKSDIYENPKDFRLSPTYYMEDIAPLWLGKYKTKSGKDELYYPNEIYIIASPILINGVPFSLKAKLTVFPALSIAKPNKVFKDKLGYSYPHLLSVVRLFSNSSLLQEKSDEISNMLKQKYSLNVAKSNPNEGVGSSMQMLYSGMALQGDKESYLSAEESKNEYLIKYETTYYIQQYQDLYRNLLKELELQKTKGKKDLKNSL